MAEIEKQVIAYQPMSQKNEIAVLLDGDWAIKVDRVWGKKKVERYMLKTLDQGQPRWFECSETLFREIKETLDSFGEIDFNALGKANLIINREGDKYKVSVRYEEMPKRKLKNRIRGWFGKRSV